MRKCALPTELANLTDDQLTQLDRWLDRFTFAKVQDLFLETHKFPIGRGKLNRFNARRLKARALSQADAALTAADLVALKNGAPIPDDRLNKELLLRRTLQMLPRVTSAFHLRELHQIATYEERRAMDERNLQIQERAADIRLYRADIRERQLAFHQRLAADKFAHSEAICESAPSTTSQTAEGPSGSAAVSACARSGTSV
ncbi:MAG TPA: hypothetical protein VF773_15855 [Verrucomicrobiae bacterium]